MSGVAPRTILSTLVAHDVDFVVIGGLAAAAHGSRRMTRDIDVVVKPDDENLTRLDAALAELSAVQLRPGGKEAPITPADIATIALGTSLHTSSPAGRLDIVGAPAGGPSYPDLRGRSIIAEVGGIAIHVSGLDDLIAMKRAAGRPLDLQDIADLTAAEAPAEDEPG
jgi:hypothetical protein